MKEKYLPNQKYYKFYCGVVVDEKTMKRIQEVLYKAETEIKYILYKADNVRPYNWSLVNIMDGDKIKKQKTFNYSSFYSWDSATNRINMFKLETPKYMDNFYEVKSEEELADLKKCLLEELKAEVE